MSNEQLAMCNVQSGKRSRLDELIQELCPNGVEYKTLADVTTSVNIGINPRKFFKLNPEDADCFYVTVRELNGLKGVCKYDKTDRINREAVRVINERANIEIGDLLFSNTGTVGKMALVTEKPDRWGVNEGIYVIKPKHEIILSKYLYYYLSGNDAYKDYSSKFTGSTLKHVTQAALLSLKIPVPPLPVQSEIVRILDNFTELTAELTARKKQYEFYRDKLLSMSNVQCAMCNVELSDIVRIKNGKDYKHLADGNIPVYGSGGIMTYVNEYCYDKPSVLIPRKGSLNNLFYVDTPFWNVDTIFYTEIDESKIVPKYLFYLLQKEHLENMNNAGGVPSLTQAVLNKIKLTLPPLEVQNRIVNVLDNFDAICSDLKIGLPAEIEARQKQYEFYRDALLTYAATGKTILGQTDRQTDRRA